MWTLPSAKALGYFRRTKFIVSLPHRCGIGQGSPGIANANGISALTLVSSDLGDTLADLHAGRSCDWFPLRDIPEASRLLPPPPKSEPEPPRPVSRRYVVFQVVLTLICVGVAFAEQRWFLWGIAGLMVWEAGAALQRYTKQQPRGEAV